MGICSLIAHQCGPATIELEVGQTCPWRITADRLEAMTVYTPSIRGATNSVRVTPSAQTPFQGHHGDFTFTGMAPGKAVLTVGWSYAPTQASGVCTVEITVKAATGGNQKIDEGRLSTFSDSVSVRASLLARMIEIHVPPEAKKLLVFAQCYGGNVALDPRVRSLTNTTILSATAPGVTARYGGYHDDAARALTPGDGKTALDVHHAGSLGRHALGLDENEQEFGKENIAFASEWPLISGTMDAADFSLAPTSNTGEVRSRHVVFYAGNPSTRLPRLANFGGVTVPIDDGSTGQPTTITDAADRDQIVNNFTNQPNTTVQTVGGEPAAPGGSKGKDGWDYAGTEIGLLSAIQQAGNAIKQSPNPEKEQFILFVGDHGVEGSGSFPASPTTIAGRPAPGLRSPRNVANNSVTFDGFVPFAEDSFAARQMRDAPANQPGFVMFLDFSAAPVALQRDANGNPRPLFSPGNVELLVFRTPVDAPLRLAAFTEQSFDLDADGMLGSVESEGVELFFPVVEEYLLSRLLGGQLHITVTNNSPGPVVVGNIAQIVGSIERDSVADSTLPIRLENVRLAAGQLLFLLRGSPGVDYAIEQSSDLRSWLPLRFVKLISQTEEIAVPISNVGRMFYRASEL